LHGIREEALIIQEESQAACSGTVFQDWERLIYAAKEGEEKRTSVLSACLSQCGNSERDPESSIKAGSNGEKSQPGFAG